MGLAYIIVTASIYRITLTFEINSRRLLSLLINNRLHIAVQTSGQIIPITIGTGSTVVRPHAKLTIQANGQLINSLH